MKKPIAILITVALLVSTCCLSVSAGENTTYTYTMSTDNSAWIKTQDAYLPGNAYQKGQGLSQPEDIFIHGGEIYTADTGNTRQVKTSPTAFASCPSAVRSSLP